MHDNRKITKFIALFLIWLIFMALVIFYDKLTGIEIILLLIVLPVFIIKTIDNIFDKKENEKQKQK